MVSDLADVTFTAPTQSFLVARDTRLGDNLTPSQRPLPMDWQSPPSSGLGPGALGAQGSSKATDHVKWDKQPFRQGL